MSTELQGLQSSRAYKLSLDAEGDVTKHAAVIPGTADNEVAMPTAADQATMGITECAAADGETVDVITHGPAIAVAGAAVAVNALVKIAGTSGKVITATPGSGVRCVGRALSSAAADGDYITVFVEPGHIA